MENNKSSTKKENINIEKIVKEIFNDIYQLAFVAQKCVQCDSAEIECTNVENAIYKCKSCKFSFSPRTNSLYQKIRYSDERFIKFISCMINDISLEEVSKIIQSNAESVKKKWTLIYENVEWSKYNISVRPTPTKNVYADFDVIIG